jgi:hypothetical protein
VALFRIGTVRVFRQKSTLEDVIGSHACSLESSSRVTNGIPLGWPLLLPVHTVNCVQTLKAYDQHLWRVRTKELAKPEVYSSWVGPLEGDVEPEKLWEKTVSDGMAVDKHGQIYFTDFEHSAVSVIQSKKLPKQMKRMMFANGQIGNVTTLIEDTELLRWPTSVHISGRNKQQVLYITCSVSHEIDIKEKFENTAHVEADGPFHILTVRLWPHPRRMTPIDIYDHDEF